MLSTQQMDVAYRLQQPRPIEGRQARGAGNRDERALEHSGGADVSGWTKRAEPGYKGSGLYSWTGAYYS
jgi:hypothetical protein